MFLKAPKDPKAMVQWISFQWGSPKSCFQVVSPNFLAVNDPCAAGGGFSKTVRNSWNLDKPYNGWVSWGFLYLNIYIYILLWTNSPQDIKAFFCQLPGKSAHETAHLAGAQHRFRPHRPHEILQMSMMMCSWNRIGNWLYGRTGC